MAITTSISTSFKKEQLDGLHQMSAAGAAAAADTFKIAVFVSAASLGPSTTAYSATNEASGTGYVAGGATLSGLSVGTLGNWAYLQCNDASWAGASFTGRGFQIYNSSRSNKSVGVVDFGADKTATGGTFLIDLGNSSTNAASITFAATTMTRAAGDFVADGYQIGQTVITDDATNPGPYVITGVATTVLTFGGASMTAGGPRSVSLKAVVLYW